MAPIAYLAHEADGDSIVWSELASGQSAAIWFRVRRPGCDRALGPVGFKHRVTDQTQAQANLTGGYFDWDTLNAQDVYAPTMFAAMRMKRGRRLEVGLAVATTQYEPVAAPPLSSLC